MCVKKAKEEKSNAAENKGQATGFPCLLEKKEAFKQKVTI